MTDHEMLMHVSSELGIIAPRLSMLQTAVNQHLNAVVPPQPPIDPVVPPPDSSSKPPSVGFMVGPALTGSHGNPKMVSGILGNTVVSYEYAIAADDGLKNFYAAGQAFNGTPPSTWIWIAGNPDGTHYFTPPTKFGGTGVSPIEGVNAAWLRSQGIAKFYFCEQPQPDGQGTQWNRYAQVG